jgi:hypothetical protein
VAKRLSSKSQRKPSEARRATNLLGFQELVAFVGTIDPGRAKVFYRDTLGLPLEEENRFALIFNVSGTMLRVTAVPEVAIANYTILGWRVANIVQTAKGLRKARCESAAL